ncbi:MAG: HD domain-containing protein, partial [bacterium]|nr:HD domain-containing protein [bacterium]
SDAIRIEDFRAYAVNKGEMGHDVSYENRNASAHDFQSFQENFHPEVRKWVGDIFNYISYHGKEVFIIAFNYRKPVNRFMAQVFKNFTLNGNFFKLMQGQLEGIKDAYNYALDSLARAAEASDELTGEHIVRVNYYSRYIAQQLQLPEKLVTDIFNSAKMHDIGKIHIHPDIIRKPGKLTEAEWVEMRRHPESGAKILGKSEYMDVAQNICMGHHENSDGSGYPSGLKNAEIPIEARIVHLADVYDSLRSPRSYKPAFSHEKTMGTILKGDGRTGPEHFDPDCIAVLKNNAQIFADIYDSLTHKD